MSTLYLAGPMTGYAEHNFPAFHEAEQALVAEGHRVLNPARGSYGERSWSTYLRRDLRMVCRAVVKREQGVRGSHDEWSERIREEIADVVIAATAIAATEGFDLGAVVAKRWAHVESRDSVALRPPAA